MKVLLSYRRALPRCFSEEEQLKYEISWGLKAGKKLFSQGFGEVLPKFLRVFLKCEEFLKGALQSFFSREATLN
jgi:hypothetical protein